MRTTVTIRDDLYEAARRRAFEQRKTLGAVMNELIARGLADGPGPARELGAFVGQIGVADDFDEPVAAVELALDEPLGP